MNRNRLSLILFLACLFAASCTNPKASVEPAAPKDTAAAKNADKSEVILSPDQQTAALIETRPAATSNEPDILRAKGRITLADDHTWRVGVRTVGLVVAVYAG